MPGENSLVDHLARSPEHLLQVLSHSQLPGARCVWCLVEVFHSEKLSSFKASSWYGKFSCACLFGPFGRQFCISEVLQFRTMHPD